jgi:hypothetical protein
VSATRPITARGLIEGLWLYRSRGLIYEGANHSTVCMVFSGCCLVRCAAEACAGSAAGLLPATSAFHLPAFPIPLHQPPTTTHQTSSSHRSSNPPASNPTASLTSHTHLLHCDENCLFRHLLDLSPAFYTLQPALLQGPVFFFSSSLLSASWPCNLDRRRVICSHYSSTSPDLTFTHFLPKHYNARYSRPAENKPAVGAAHSP